MNSNPDVHSSIIHSSIRYIKDRAFKEYGRGTFPVPRRGYVRFSRRFEGTWGRRLLITTT